MYILGSEAVGRDIWEGTAAAVEEGGIVSERCRADLVLEVVRDIGFLVVRLAKVVAEATTAGNPCYFGADRLRATHCGDVWACTRELGRELRSLLAVVGLTWSADACSLVLVRRVRWAQDVAKYKPVSPDDSSTEMPRSPNWPIMLHTRFAYAWGTVLK